MVKTSRRIQREEQIRCKCVGPFKTNAKNIFGIWKILKWNYYSYRRFILQSNYNIITFLNYLFNEIKYTVVLKGKGFFYLFCLRSVDSLTEFNIEKSLCNLQNSRCSEQSELRCSLPDFYCCWKWGKFQTNLRIFNGLVWETCSKWAMSNSATLIICLWKVLLGLYTIIKCFRWLPP